MEKDARFSGALRDARFRGSKRKKDTVELDERFKKQLKSDAFTVRRRVDKYGRTIRRDGRVGYGRHTETDMEVADAKRMFGLLSGDLGKDKVGEVEVSESSDEESLAADEEEDGEENKEVIKRGEATNRIAVLGLDWDYAKAVDLFACFSSFCPSGETVLKVAIHPSEYGIAQMKKEKKLGPTVMNKDDAKTLEQAHRLRKDLDNIDSIDGDENNDDALNASERPVEPSTRFEEESANTSDCDSDSDSESIDVGSEEAERRSQAALREYEENRTKYYYAVAEFSSPKAGSAIYDELDGLEYSASGRVFDLRFIPVDFRIPYLPREVATSLPAAYKPSTSNPSTLNNSKVRLMWDADHPDRVKLRKKSFTKEEIESMDLRAYLGSDSESDDEDNESKAARINRIRKLLLLNDDKSEDERDGTENEAAGVGMEVIFEPGLEEKGEDILRRREERERKGQETLGEAQNRKREEARLKKLKKWKEERKLAKLSSKKAKDLHDDANGNPFAGDPFFTSGVSRKEERRIMREERRLQRGTESSHELPHVKRHNAELELVMMDEKPLNEHRRAALAESDEDDEDEERRRRKKGTRGKRRRGRLEKRQERAFVPNINDPRFRQILEGKEFTLDPTHPKYAKSETNKRLLAEKIKRSSGQHETPGGEGSNKQAQVRENFGKESGMKNRYSEVLCLATNLKNRS